MLGKWCTGCAAVLFSAVACEGALAAPAVTNTNDSGSGSLRAALAGASSGDTINVPPGTYRVTSGELTVSTGVTLVGSGASSTIIDGTMSSRILHSTGGSLSISGLTFTNGKVAGAGGGNQGGGAIRVDNGPLNVSGSVFSSNVVTAGPLASGNSGGGAIWAGGAAGAGGNVTVSNSTFSRNSASVNGGNASGGGALLVTGVHSVSLTSDQFSGDAFTQANGAGNDGGGGLASDGGAITLSGTSFSGETATIDEPNFGNSGGGAIYDGGGGTTATNSSLNGNSLTITGASNVVGGGALYADGAGAVSLTGSTIAHNTANLGGQGAAALLPNAGGGGIFAGGPISMLNTTLSDNALNLTSGASPSDGGGGLYDSFVDGTLTNVTVAGNSANVPGGGLEEFTGTLTIKNTIVAQNTAPANGNCGGSIFQSRGNNLEDANTCSFTQPSDLTGTNPQIASLADNGGPTQTRALLPNSPAIDHADNSACPATDQRGVGRPQPAGGTCDIGAFEFVPQASGATPGLTSPLTTGVKRPRGTKPRVRISGVPGGCVRHDFTVKVTITSATALKSDSVRVDAKRLQVPTAKAFRVRIHAARQSGGRRHLSATATNAAGRTTAVVGYTRCAGVVSARPLFTG